MELFINYFGENRRKMNEPLCELAWNYAKWEYKENENVLSTTFENIHADSIKSDQVPIIGIVGGSGSGKVINLLNLFLFNHDRVFSWIHLVGA